jgi:hypothetical protein
MLQIAMQEDLLRLQNLINQAQTSNIQELGSDDGERKKARLETEFYSCLHALKAQFKKSADDPQLSVSEQLAQMSELIDSLHGNDKAAGSVMPVFQEGFKAGLTSLENQLESNVRGKLIHCLANARALLDRNAQLKVRIKECTEGLKTIQGKTIPTLQEEAKQLDGPKKQKNFTKQTELQIKVNELQKEKDALLRKVIDSKDAPSASELYTQAEELEKIYESLGSEYLKHDLEVEPLIIELRMLAAKESIGEGVVLEEVEPLSGLTEKQREQVNHQCLQFYQKSVQMLEEVVPEVAAQKPEVQDICRKLFGRLTKVVKVHSKIETEAALKRPKRVMVMSELARKINSLKGEVISEGQAIFFENILNKYWKSTALEAEDFAISINQKENSSTLSIEELTKTHADRTQQAALQVIDDCSLITERILEVLSSNEDINKLEEMLNFLQESKGFLIAEGAQEDVSKFSGLPYLEQLKGQVKGGAVFGSDNLSIAGSLGLNPVSFDKIQEEGNIRELLTAAVNSIMSRYFGSLLGDRQLIEKINAQLEEGFDINQNLANKYKKQTGRFFNPKKGITADSRAPRGAPLHAQTRIERAKAKQGVGLKEENITAIPLSKREERTIHRSSLTTSLTEQKKPEFLPWKTGRQSWEVQHVPLGTTHGFAQEASFHFLEVIAGPSGTADRLFELAEYLGILENEKDYQTFRLACLAYLQTIDAHSYHEVMLGASAYNYLDYEAGSDSYDSLFSSDSGFINQIVSALDSKEPGMKMPKHYLSQEYQMEVAKYLGFIN